MNVHEPAKVYRDNLGNVWRMECTCGYTTEGSLRMQDIGEEFDEHCLNEAGEEMASEAQA